MVTSKLGISTEAYKQYLMDIKEFSHLVDESEILTTQDIYGQDPIKTNPKVIGL
jgi:hypothetical protein